MTRRLCLMFALAACADDPTNGLPQPDPFGGDDVWTGTAEITLETAFEGFTSTKVTHADVTWTLDEAAGYHVPSGTVSYTEDTSYDNSPNPPCLVTASYTGAIDPSSSSLFLDADSYAGVGIELNVPITVVDSCNGANLTPTQLTWFGPSSMGVLAGDTIDFEATMPAGADTTQTSSYHFETSP